MKAGEESVGTAECKQKLECQFGPIEFDDEETVDFSGGLFGFTQYHRFLLWDHAHYFPFRWLISVENPNLIFPVIDPRLALPDYDPRINSDNEWDTILAIVTIGESKETVTMNLRAPLLLDDTRRSGKQIILTDTDYSLRYNIVKSPQM